MIKGKVCALMATANRPAFVARAVECFLRQDYPNRHLWILNNCETPLRYDHPLITVINEPGHQTLGHCRNRLLQFADGEFLRIYDDDDLNFVWSFSQGVERIGDAPAWKPTRSWWCDGSGQANSYSQPPGTFALASNAMEASITWRTQAVRDAGGWFEGQGNESKLLLQRVPVAHDDMGIWPGYCYMYGQGQFHASATIGQPGSEAGHSHAWAQAQRPVDVTSYLEECRRLVRFIESRLQTGWLKAAYGQWPAYTEPVTNSFAQLFRKPRSFYSCCRVIAAPGCWDLLHQGHIDTLEWARGQGDALAVLINDDIGVRSQKRGNRPLIPLEGRIASLAALSCVNLIGVIEGIDDRPWLEALNPAAVVKGPEYAGREASVPHPPGCEVLIAPVSSFTAHTTDLATFPVAQATC